MSAATEGGEAEAGEAGGERLDSVQPFSLQAANESAGGQRSDEADDAADREGDAEQFGCEWLVNAASAAFNA